MEEPKSWLKFKIMPFYFWALLSIYLLFQQEWILALCAAWNGFIWVTMLKFFEMATDFTLAQYQKLFDTLLSCCYLKPGLQMNEDGTLSPKENKNERQ